VEGSRQKSKTARQFGRKEGKEDCGRIGRKEEGKDRQNE
jgi:hypothetical protein